MMSRSAKVNRLEEITLILYENEDPENYDIDGAVCYWNAMSEEELNFELSSYETRLNRYLLP